MSGGFFRGTSAEQDTRFSNKQAKLMKSHKFPPELDHLVDMTKVKMDVMKPWIAKRVTELIGFEDEVLINFIYGLLERKIVNGKEVQIQLTGFMERNTAKFMKELWLLLLSAQSNATGVPQQFLEAKEEEMRKKTAETDRITNEIQRKKERENRERELHDQEKRKKMDDLAAALEPSQRSMDDDRNGSRGRKRVSTSPHSADHSPSPRRSRSIRKSLSNSMSYSGERRRPHNTSGSPEERRGCPRSSERVYRSPPRRSISPRRKHSPLRSLSPPRLRRRSTSRVRRRSPSLARYRRRSPFRRRSRSPIRRRSRSPIRRRSRTPIRHRTRSPQRRRPRSPSRRSPVRYRSRSPIRRRSPPSIRRRTPSPTKHRSPSPMTRGYSPSPLSPRRSSPSPVQRKSFISSRKRSLTPARRRSITPVGSLSPRESLSPSPIYRRSPSPVKKRISMNERSPVQSPHRSIRREKYTPVRHASPAKAEARKGSRSLECRNPISSRSPLREMYDSKVSRRKESPFLPPQRGSPSVSESPCHSGSGSESPPAKREKSPGENGGTRSSLNRREIKTIHADSPSPRKSRGRRVHSNFSEDIADEKEKNHSREPFEHKPRSSRNVLTTADPYKDLGEGRDEEEFPQLYSGSDRLESRKRHEVIKSEKFSGRIEHSKELDQQKSPSTHRHSYSGKRAKESYDGESFKADEDNLSLANNTKGKKLQVEAETPLASSRNIEKNDRSGNDGSGSEESKECRAERKEKRKHKRSGRYQSSSDDSYDSAGEDRKEAKRKRKEEKRSKKEEKHRRREERRRRKEEKRAQKLMLRSANAMSTPQDTERNPYDGAFDDEHVRKEDQIDSDSLQKRLEIELREKALESLRAKKGISH